jgi:solute carrier family 35 protein E3
MEVFEANIKPILYALFNIVSVTAIVVVNKKVFNELHFHFPICLVLVHTIITYIGMRSAAALGFFEMKQTPLQPRLFLAVAFVFYNGSSLVNLNINTVGFYQISKILVTPAVMSLNYVLYGETTTQMVKAAVGVMLVGVTMATVSDVDVTPVGGIIGICAVAGSAQYQILIGKTQKDLQASANQLLVSYTPYVMVFLALLTPLDKLLLDEEQTASIGSYSQWMQLYGSVNALGIIALSGCCGLLVSLSTFLMIGATSPLTYNIVGHLKTVSILIMGVTVFGDSVSANKFFGIALALAGVIWYSKIKMDAQNRARVQRLAPAAVAGEEVGSDVAVRIGTPDLPKK